MQIFNSRKYLQTKLLQFDKHYVPSKLKYFLALELLHNKQMLLLVH